MIEGMLVLVLALVGLFIIFMILKVALRKFEVDADVAQIVKYIFGFLCLCILVWLVYAAMTGGLSFNTIFGPRGGGIR